MEEVAELIQAESGARPRVETEIAGRRQAPTSSSPSPSTVDDLVDADRSSRGHRVRRRTAAQCGQRQCAELRDDVFVFEGGVVAPPGDVEFNFDFGFPPKTCYACMAETMALALGRPL